MNVADAIAAPRYPVSSGVRIPNIKRMGRIDVSGALEALEADPSLWTDHTFRQTAERTAHRDTEAIYLFAPPKIEGRALVDCVEGVEHRGMQVPALRALVERIRARHRWTLARAMIVSLKPGGKIIAHTDCGEFADSTERFHAVIATNPWAWLRSGDDTAHLRAGHFYWFNKHVPHDGANDGQTPRIHLIADYYWP